MARKDLLKGLMEGAEKPAEEARVNPGRPRYTKGAIGAVSQSLADLKTRAITDLDPHLIEAGGMDDRLESDPADDQALTASIETYGQQVPVLVRPHPTTEGRYQIVYGRRRVLAMRDLGQPVKAMIRDLDDAELVMAQGQENSARRDLSFIEKANFARQMRDAGYERKAMCDALHIDKTVISRMLSVVDRIPLEILHTIGAAPGIGRDRWGKMAELIEKDEAGIAVPSLITGETSDERFESLIKALTLPRREASPLPRRPSRSVARTVA